MNSSNHLKVYPLSSLKASPFFSIHVPLLLEELAEHQTLSIYEKIQDRGHPRPDLKSRNLATEDRGHPHNVALMYLITRREKWN